MVSDRIPYCGLTTQLNEGRHRLADCRGRAAVSLTLRTEVAAREIFGGWFDEGVHNERGRRGQGLLERGPDLLRTLDEYPCTAEAGRQPLLVANPEGHPSGAPSA